MRKLARFASSILAGRGILVKFLIALGIFKSNVFILIHFNIIETQACILVTLAWKLYNHRPRPLY